MPNIFFVRSGQTEDQERGILVGRKDANLNETGYWQARCLAQRFAGSKIHHIAVSPLRRSVATAMHICEQSEMVPELVGGFEGVDLGEWEGQSKEWLLSCDAARFLTWSAEPDFPAPGGESLRNIYRRAFPDLVQLVEKVDPQDSIIVVASGTILRVLCCGILELPLSSAMSFRLDFGSVSSFERLYPGGPYQIVNWNGVSHLGQRAPSALELEQEIP